MEGALWMLGSGLCFVGVQGVVRYLGTDLPAAQSAFLRFLFGVGLLLPVLPGLLRRGFPAAAWRLFALRGVVHTGAVLFWFYAMARIPVAHVTAIGYLSPVLLLIVSSAVLGERVTGRRVVAVLLAFVGALIVLRPGVQPLALGHLSQIGAACCFAGSYLCAKRLSAMVPATAVVAMLSLTVMLGLAPLAWLAWVPVGPVQLAWLALVAALATLAHYCMTRAFRVAPLTVTQPVTFLQLIWATLLGATLFGEPVDGFVLLGGALIIGAISWVTWRDARAAAGLPDL